MAGDSPPFVSVIMPVRNEEKFIRRSLGAVLAQDYPRDRLEVLISDGMSHDNTRRVIMEMAVKNPDIRIEIVDNCGMIVPTGFNKALEQSSGEIIVRIDGHTIVAADYVRQCVNALQRSGADNVGGCMRASGETEFAKAVSGATSSRFGVGGARFHYLNQEAWVDTVYMGAWPRQIFDKIGLFDEEQVRNQDDEFNYRLREEGGRIFLTPSIKSIYYNRATPASLFRQYYQYGYWKVRVMQKHPSQMRMHHFLPPLFVAIVIVGVIAAPAFSLGRQMTALALVSYCVCNLVATLLVIYHQRSIRAMYLSLSFFAMHFGYGLGFLVGLIKFAGTWTDRGRRKFPATGTARKIV